MVTYKFSFFFNLVEKNSFIVKKISKCRENGIDRLRNGNLRRRDQNLDFVAKMASSHDATSPWDLLQGLVAGTIGVNRVCRP